MCVFCKIISGEFPSYKIYEDEKTLAFLDIDPVHAGHALVVPKAHYDNIEATPEAELSAVMATVKKVGALLKDKLGAPGYNINENNDPVAGQVVSHLHFHLIPRYADDGLELWPKQGYQAGEAAAVLKKLLS